MQEAQTEEEPFAPEMPDIPGTQPSVIVNLTPKSKEYLERLVEQGIFGASVGEVAGRLLDDQLRKVVSEGWCR